MEATRTARREARCDEIIEIARSVLLDDGLEQFVLRDIATRAGMKLGHLQYYFPTRADLLEAVVRADFDRDLAAVRAAIARLGKADPRANLEAVSRALLSNWAAGGSSVWFTLATLGFHDARFRDLNVAVYRQFYEEIAEAIRPAAGSVTNAELAARARLITAILDGVAVQIHAALANDTRQRRDLERRAVALVVAVAVAGVA